MSYGAPQYGGPPPTHQGYGGAQQYPAGQQYPGGGHQFPGQQVPVGGQQFPPGGQQYPVGGQQYPVGGQQYPVGGQQYPVGGQQYPAAGQQFPAGGQQPQAWGGPPQQLHQGPPQQLQQQGYPTPPSPGYDPNVIAQGDASRDANALRSAMKGFGTDEKALINILSKPDPLQMALLRNTYTSIHRRDLLSDIHSETSGSFRDGLMALVRGPLAQDAFNVNHAIKGMGTKETLLNDVLIGRSNADMRAVKQNYQHTFHKSMESDVRGDLSMKTEKLFEMLMAANRAEESAPIIPQEIETQVGDLYAATLGRTVGADQITVCNVLTTRSAGQIRAIAQRFEARYQTPLIKALDKRFDGHMEDALVLLIKRACDPAMTDAEQLESAMSGVGTKDYLLVQRIVRIHWNRDHLDQVKRAYQHRYKRDLIGRVKGEIRSKHYEALMVACLT